MEVDSSRHQKPGAKSTAISSATYTNAGLHSANNRVTMNGTTTAATNTAGNAAAQSSHPTPSDMNQLIQSFNSVVDASEADDAVSDFLATAHQPSPARAAAATIRGRGRGRGSRGGRGKVIQPVQSKALPGRGRRQKVYDSSRAQAAHERMQEVKQAFAAIAKWVKPAVQEIADRSINELLENPAIIEKVPEYGETQNFLKKRHQDAIDKTEKACRFGIEMAQRVYENEQEAARESCAVSHDNDFGSLLPSFNPLFRSVKSRT